MIQARRSFGTFTICALTLAFATSCEKRDSDKVAEAQACLDAASSSTALSCMAKVDGVDTEAANMIRCSANFIYQEFAEPTRLARIADQMKGGSGGGSAAVALGILAFSKASGSNTAAALAQLTSGYCVASKSKGMILLSQMALVGSTLATAAAAIITECDASQAGFDQNNCNTEIVQAACQTDPATLGTAAQTAYQQSCVGSSQANSSVCQQFAQVTAGTTDPTTIGENLQAQLNNNTACP